MREDKIIKPYFKSLGDHLQHSVFARRFSELGHRVYLSSKAEAWNKEIIDLVWYQNPYILGLSDAEPNVGDLETIPYRNYCDNFIGNWEIAHGLEPKSTKPEVYYQPNKIEWLADKVVVDISCRSLAKEYDFDKVFSYLISHYEDMVHLKGNNICSDIEMADDLDVANIYYYCDIITSCKKFVCLSAGGNCLASAYDINADCIMQQTPTMLSMLERKLFMFENVNYIWQK
jgi:hypothetical protein